jgi:hypothetical protein
MDSIEPNNAAEVGPETPETPTETVTPAPPVMLNMTLLAARLSATRDSIANMVRDGGFPIDARTPDGHPLWFESSLPALKKIWRQDCLRWGSRARMEKAGIL